jgi:hypothetical protein
MRSLTAAGWREEGIANTGDGNVGHGATNTCQPDLQCAQQAQVAMCSWELKMETEWQ